MSVSVLGPLELREPSGATVRMASDRQRKILAALALRANDAVPADVLIEVAWGEALPDDPTATLHTNIARLRRSLPEGVEIATDPRGYRLAVARDALDVTAFEDAVATGKVDEALGLWRGRPFADLDTEAGAIEAARLRELRAAAIETRGQHLVDQGRAAEAIAPLEELVAEDPLREPAVAVLVQALAATGRQSDALRAFSRLRSALAEELGIEPSAALRAVEERVLLQDVASGRATPNDLPRPISSFVGRRAEVAALEELLATQRVVTLCGPGGVGKTRLAIQVGNLVAARHADGAVLVDLADASTADDADQRFAAALKVAAPAGSSLREHVLGVLRVQDRVLVVDNCEHVADVVAPLVEEIATTTAGVVVLATSREPLRIDGERVVPVTPLPRDDAVALLRDRAAGSGRAPGLQGGDDDALLAEIAARLDDLPLAIELAAARVRSVGLDGLVDALDDPYSLLRGGRRTASDRHRSLRDVVAWSHDLLPEAERRLFDALGVFAGDVDAATITTVCADAVGQGTDLRLPLAELVERSLLSATGPPTRYGMLATVRAYARERLASSPTARALRERHTRWITELVVEVGADVDGPREAAAVARFDAYLPEVARALPRLAEEQRHDELLGMAVVIAHMAYERMRGDLAALTDDAVSAAGGVEHALTPRLLAMAANLAWQRGDLGAAAELCDRAVAISERVDPAGARFALQARSSIELFRGEHHAAADHARQAVDLAAAAGDRGLEASASLDLAVIEALAGEGRGADALLHGTAVAEESGSPRLRGWAAYTAGESIVEHDVAAAVPHLERAVDLAAEVDAAFLRTVASHTLLTSAGRTGQVDLDAYGRLVDDWHRAGMWTQLWVAMRALVEALGRAGRHDDAVRLLAAHDASPRAVPAHGPDAARLAQVSAAARDALGDDYEALWLEGSGLDDAGAVNLARRLTAAR